MILDGNFGKTPEQLQEPLERISESAKLMTLSIEDFLNVSRIESGNMKYELSKFNLRSVTENIVNDISAEVEKAKSFLRATCV